MSDLRKRLDNLSLEKRELLLQKLQTHKQISSTSDIDKVPPLIAVSREQTVPLSFAQQCLWFLDQLEGGSVNYNMATGVRLIGFLQVAALEQVIAEIVQRHEVLRTNFKTVNGTAVQVIAPSLTFTLPMLDLQALTAEEKSAEVQRLAREEAHRPFDLANDLLLRVSLMRLGADEHVLLLTMHHIVSDAWSIGIFVQELAILYKAFSCLEPSPLPELPIQYADFACWQHQWLQGKVRETQINYWKQKLTGSSPVLELSTDRPRPPIQTFQGDTQHFQIGLHLTQKLKTFSQESGATLFMTLLTVFAILLSRYSGMEDIAIGSPVANRNRLETESLIGFFVNTLVLRIDLSGKPRFPELLARVQQVALDAYAHQDLPFEQVVEALHPERNLSYNPLFQVMFNFEHNSAQTLDLPGLNVTSLAMENVTTKFDLTLSLTETNLELTGELEYNTDLFNPSTMSRLLEHFQTLLEGIVTNPHQPIFELPLLTTVERHQLLMEWNNTQVEYVFDRCIHQLFEAQVERTPKAVAVMFENQQLTYQQLNCRANQLAHHLQAIGVKSEVLVGICLERSLEMLVGLLAIFKAGGVYVPLDPDYPKERLAYILSDSQVSVLLTHKNIATALPENKARVVYLDTDSEVISQQSEQNPVSVVANKNLAYVIYTSGSTGMPKGVMIEHRGMLNHLYAKIWDLKLTETDAIAQTAPQSFDISVWQLLVGLLVGGRVEILSNEIVHNPAKLLEQIEKQGISILEVVPSLLQMMLLEIESHNQERPHLSKLRWLILTGEALPPNLCDRWLNHYPTIPILNAYGPTECSDDVTHYPIYQPLGGETLNTPIGRAVANTQLYILNPQLQPVPIGVAGELYVGGAGVGRGYLNKPELTDQAFIPNVFGTEGTRLYKTGDKARYLSDGNIEFLGRIDYQVKIRGFRIELGEIEGVLAQHPDLRETVVITREDRAENKHLVAYVVPHREPPTTSQLRCFLKKLLPDYMVPSLFVSLDALPLTANGKVDRNALPEPDLSRMGLEVDFILPRTPTEEILVKNWIDVLGREQVSIHDNFFELGGDSVLSIQVVAHANQAGLLLTPKLLFQHQTIAELASVLSTTLPVQAEQGVVTGQVPLTPIQHWFFAQNLSQSHHYNQSVLLEVLPNLNPELLKQAVQQLLVHHDALRLRFTLSNSWQQVNTAIDETAVPFTVSDLSKLSASEQRSFLEATADELQVSLNLSNGPIIRVALFQLGNDKPGRLLLIIHHLAVDGVSWRILLEDLATAYQQLSQGKAVQLPAKTTAFKDWASRLMEYVQSLAVAGKWDYWLAQSSTSAFLPVDYPLTNTANTGGSAAQVSVSLSVEQTQALLQDVPAVYNTQINDVLLTALVQTFFQWTGKRSLLVDLEGHGREELFEDVDLSRTVGWFTTVFPVRLQLGEIEHLGELLKSVKEQLRCLPNQGIDYGILRYLSQDTLKQSQLEALPQAEVSFNYLGQFDRVISKSPLLGFAKESSGQNYSSWGNRSYKLEIDGFVESGKLELNWTYSTNVYQRLTIERLAQSFIKVLTDLLAHCQSSELGGFTPSDFPEAGLNQQELDRLVAKLNTSQK